MMGLLRQMLDRVSIYLPVILMGLLALGTYWLVRNTPIFAPAETERAERHEADYFMRGFSIKTYDATGRIKSEVYGQEARHFPDNDTLEIDHPRIRSFSEQGRLTVATADRALSNGDGSEVQLLGNAVVVREALLDKTGVTMPPTEYRGEFLHAFMNTERIKSHKPVTLRRGDDQFRADALDYDNVDRTVDMRGRVSATLMPRKHR